MNETDIRINKVSLSRKEEEDNLKECIAVIEGNIKKYQKEEATMSADIKDMYEHYHSDSPEMYTELSNTSTMYENVRMTLFKNKEH